MAKKKAAKKRSQPVKALSRRSSSGSVSAPIPPDRIESMIKLIRGERVILDYDLAELYGVTTGRLNEQVKRNAARFPEDFTFHLSAEELTNLKSQSATSSSGWGGRRKPPRAFSEHGAIMAANVLSSPRAIQTSVFVVRAFVRLRRMMAQHVELASRLDELERTLEGHDRKITVLVDAIRQLMAPSPDPPKKRIGFHTETQG